MAADKPSFSAKAVEKTLLGLLEQRRGKTICPSEVARALDNKGFRTLMPLVREVAAKLQKRGRVLASQRGQPIEDVLAAKGPIRLSAPPSDYEGIDFREHPELYRVGRGERGVLSAEPYKSELLPLWRFKTPAIARESAAALWKAFVAYRSRRDFVGMDMARKFLQMGFTRARRYANHASGRKYDARGNALEAKPDAEKAQAASHFYAVWQKAERDRVYRRWRASLAEES